MPTYEYQCSQCGNRLEAVQSFTEDPLKDCPECGDPSLRKLFGNVGVVFKGSGFYRNDARAEDRKRDKKSGSASGTTSGSKSGTKADTKTSDKPSAAKSGSAGKGGSSGKSGSGSPS